VDVLPSVIGATVAIHAAVGLFFLAVRLRRPDEPEYGVFAVLCGVLACLGAMQAAETRAATAGDLVSASHLAFVALVAAFVLTAHFTLDYARVASQRTWVVTAYAVGTGYELANARGLLHDVPALATFREVPRVVPLTALGVSTYAAGLAVAIASLVVFARAYLGGRREALGLVVGGTVLAATLLNDLGYVSGRFGAAPLSALGYLAFVAGVGGTFLSRYVAAAGNASRVERELRQKSRELRKALADLDAAREELGKKEQLAVVGELAAVIAHEVRNPLAIIANAVAGLRKPTLGKDDQATLLSILDEETSRLNRLVSDLLRYARPVNVQRQSISLRDLLERGLQLAGNKKSLTVSLEIDVPDMRIWGDGNLLRQVFDNLIDNAVQAMHYGGRLTVRVRAMRHEERDGLAVDIIDTGEGMDTIVRSRARDPFFTTRPSGTGLGLAIVDRIVDAHGGHLLIESRAGEGTTATVFLPQGTPSEPPPPRKSARERTTDVKGDVKAG
jgi:signal transduction histidine kinase